MLNLLGSLEIYPTEVKRNGSYKKKVQRTPEKLSV